MPIVRATEDFDKLTPTLVRPEHPDKIDLAPAIVTFMTTEHFVLQTARAATIAETNGRTALFLSSVSSILVALAFFGQVSKLGPAFFVFGLVLLPALFFVGLVTFERAIQTSIEDLAYNRRISRIRRFYLEVAPSLAGHLASAGDDSRAGVMREAGITNSWWQSFVATAGTVSVINSLILGGTGGLLVGYIRGSLAASVVAGMIVGVISIGLHLARQRALWHRADEESKCEFSAAGPER